MDECLRLELQRVDIKLSRRPCSSLDFLTFTSARDQKFLRRIPMCGVPSAAGNLSKTFVTGFDVDGSLDSML
jgi:hypothetical protein